MAETKISQAEAQAVADVRAAATWVTGPNSEGGVGRAIEGLLDGSLEVPSPDAG